MLRGLWRLLREWLRSSPASLCGKHLVQIVGGVVGHLRAPLVPSEELAEAAFLVGFLELLVRLRIGAEPFRRLM